MGFLIYIFIKFPVGFTLWCLGWLLVALVLTAPIGVPMVAAGVYMMFPSKKQKIKVVHENEPRRRHKAGKRER